MQVSTDTTEYRFSHGAEPRGRGGWIFEYEVDGTVAADQPNFNGTYSDARRQATRFARENYPDAREVVVIACP